MEAEGELKIYLQSEEKQKLCYMLYMGDRDSKSYARMKYANRLWMGEERFREEGEMAKKDREEGERKQKNRETGQPAKKRRMENLL